MTLTSMMTAVFLIALLAPAVSSQLVWGRRTIEQGGITATIDDRPAVFEISVCDWESWNPTREPAIQIFPTIRQLVAGKDYPPGIQSVAMLEAESKRFNDRLYAAIDLLAQRGWKGATLGKAALLARRQGLVTALQAESPADDVARNEAVARLCAARTLGGLIDTSPELLRSRVQALISAFDSQAHRSKPIGFYTWRPALSSLFRQDRLFFLRAEDLAAPEGAWLSVIAKVLCTGEELQSAYRTVLRISSTMSNALDDRSLIDIGEKPAGTAALWPASRSHESDRLKRLYGHRPIPAGHSVMDELTSAIRPGTIKLQPTSTSGWYDHQSWALEPLLCESVRGEVPKIQYGDGYAEHCEEVFRASLSKRRETHVKQVAGPVIGANPQIIVSPHLSIEPQITVFVRTASAYRFLREPLVKLLGGEVLAGTKLVGPEGEPGESVLDGLVRMEKRFVGLAALSCSEVGADPALLGEGFTEASASALQPRPGSSRLSRC